MTFTACSEVSRTGLIEDSHVWWDSNDRIILFDNDAGNTAVVSSVAKSNLFSESDPYLSSVQFTALLTGSGPYYALYPVDGDARVDGGTIFTTFSASQTYVDKGFADDLNIGVAQSDDNNALQFKNVLCYLRFHLDENLPSDTEVDYVTMRGTNGEYLAGDIEITWQDIFTVSSTMQHQGYEGGPNYDLGTKASSGTDKLGVRVNGNPSQEVRLSASSGNLPKTGIFLLGFVPLTLSNGFYLNFHCTNGDVMSAFFRNELKARPSYIYDLGAPTATRTFEADPEGMTDPGTTFDWQ